MPFSICIKWESYIETWNLRIYYLTISIMLRSLILDSAISIVKIKCCILLVAVHAMPHQKCYKEKVMIPLWLISGAWVLLSMLCALGSCLSSTQIQLNSLGWSSKVCMNCLNMPAKIWLAFWDLFWRWIQEREEQ